MFLHFSELKPNLRKSELRLVNPERVSGSTVWNALHLSE